jgi:DNA-directed RNA polymerase subunit RPC12/RpoP
LTKDTNEFFAGLKRGAGLVSWHSKPFNPIRIMDIVFDCPNCEQELAVDSSGAGSEIECPSCHETITIPAASTKTAAAEPPEEEPHAPRLAPSVMSTSAAAKVEMHLKVPVSSKPGESLIKKSAVPLAAIARGAGKKIRTRTIKHGSCIESGHDKFDETVTEFLNEIGEANMVGVHTISYTYFDVGTQKILNDYGVLIVYRG